MLDTYEHFCKYIWESAEVSMFDAVNVALN